MNAFLLGSFAEHVMIMRKSEKNETNENSEFDHESQTDNLDSTAIDVLTSDIDAMKKRRKFQEIT